MLRNSINHFFNALLALLIPLMASANKPYAINFDTEDGLPSMEVYDLEILEDGQVWFATDRGIGIYDGYDFETLTKKEGLLHDCVLRLNKDPFGRIWVTGLDQRLCFYDGKSMQPYRWNDAIHQHIKPNAWIEDLAWDVQGNLIYMYGVNETLFSYRVDQKTGQITEYDPGEHPDHKAYLQADGKAIYNVGGQLVPNFPASTCFGMNEARKWIYYTHQETPNRLSQMHNNGSSTTDYRNFSSRIFTISYTSDGALYVGTDDGLYGFSDGDMNSVPTHSFPGITITRVSEDNIGGFWLTTIEKGIYYVPSMGFHSDTSWRDILGNETVVTVKNGPKELVVATQEGNVYLLDTTGKIQHLLDAGKFPASVETVTAGPSSIYVGPYRLLYEKGGFRMRKNIVSGLLAVSLELKNGTIFVAGYAGWEIRNVAEDSVLAKWSDKKMGRVQAVLEMPGKILIGADKGLFALEKESKALEIVTVNDTPFNYRVSDIESDQWGNCWVSTLGNGLFYLSGTEMHRISEQDGLHSGTVNGIIFDEKGRLWIATNYGLGRLDYVMENEKFRLKGIKTLTSLNGLPSNSVRDISAWQGEIYIASDEGLHAFDPALPDRELPTPKVRLKEIFVNDHPFPIDRRLELKGPVDHLEIHYSAYSALKSKQQPLYRLRLLGTGQETTWEYTNARSKRYSNLSSGSYRFEVEACNARGEWSGKPLVLFLTASKPWLEGLRLPLVLLAGVLLLVAVVWRWLRRKAGGEPVPIDTSSPAQETPETSLRFDLEQQQLVLPTGQGYKVISLRQIRYIEANGSYVVLHLEEGKQHVVSQSLTAMEELLPAELFFRIHKSFLLNCEVVEGYEAGRGGKIFLKDGSQVPIAVRRKAAFIQQMKKKGIRKVSVHK